MCRGYAEEEKSSAAAQKSAHVFVDWEPPPGMSALTPFGGVSLAWLSYSTIYAQRGTLAAYAHERPGDVASVPTTNNGHGMDKMKHAPSYDSGD